MASANASALLEALFIYGNADMLDLDKRTKAALRLCSKHLKNIVDATVVGAWIYSDDLNVDLNALINTEWHDLKNLVICENDNPIRITELPSALFVKFSRLETLKIESCWSLEAVPTEIGELRHLKTFELDECHSLAALPSSLSQLTTLEEIFFYDYNNLTAEGLAPLQHLTGVKSLMLSISTISKRVKYPDFLWSLTSLKELTLGSPSITKLPAALGNLTNLESLTIEMPKLKELPESIGKLNQLKKLSITWCFELTALPESLDDLLWHMAHETEELKMELVDFTHCSKSLFSPKMEEALDLLKKNGVNVLTWKDLDSSSDDDLLDDGEDEDYI